MLAPALAFAAGAGAVRVPSLVGRLRAPSPAIALWCADRDAGRLVGLDASLLVRVELDVAHPLFVAPAADGAVWTIADDDGSAGGAARLLKLTAAGARLVSLPVATPLGLASTAGGGVLWVEHEPGGRALLGRRTATGAVARVAVDGACCVATRWGRVAVGTLSGEVLLLEPEAHPRAARGRVALGAAVEQLAPAPGGEWWAVTAAPELVRLGPDLSVAWARRLPGPGTIAADPEREVVWWLAAGGRSARRVVPGVAGGPPDDPAGEPSVQPELLLPLRGLGRGFARHGRCFAPVPGAVFRWRDDGTGGSAQGGFDFVVEVRAAGGL